MNAVPAAAQEADQRVSAGVAAGFAKPFHGDFDFTAIAWQADVRIHTARRGHTSLVAGVRVGL